MTDNHDTPTSRPIVYDPRMGTLRDPETGRLLPKPGSRRQRSAVRRLRGRAVAGRSEAVEAAEAAGVLPEMVAQPHGGALYRGGVPGNKASTGMTNLDGELRELARMELGRMVKAMLGRFDGVEPVPATCGKCGVHATCPECGEPVWMTQPTATDAQRLAIMDAIRKIAGIEKQPIGTKQDSEPIQVTVHGAHPGHLEQQASDGMDDTQGG